jgi:hypothetical protein
MRLFLDDERFPADDGNEWHIVRSVAEAQAFIAEHGCPTFITFDHDLGYQGRDLLPTGFDLAKWLVDEDLNAGGRFFPDGFWYFVHSMNPIGAANINGLLFEYLMVHREMPEGWKLGYDNKPTTLGMRLR